MAEDGEAAEPRTRTNHALWLGPFVALVGFLSYFLFFVQWPIFRDVPWANLLLLAGALALSVIGLRRAGSRGGWRVAAGIVGLGFTGLVAAGFVFYVFSLSYQLPSAELAIAEGEPFPAMTLVAEDGSVFDTGTELGGRTIVVFFRGHW
jgi:hypothetical protein